MLSCFKYWIIPSHMKILYTYMRIHVPIITSNETMQTIPSSNVVSEFKTARTTLTGSIILQYGLSAGQQKLAIILGYQSSMQVTKGTWCITNSRYLSPAAPHESYSLTRLVQLQSVR